MNNIIGKLVKLISAVVLLLGASTEVRATKYCGGEVNASGHMMNITCEHIGANYIMTFELTGAETFYSLNSAYGNVGSTWSDFKNYGVLSPDKKVATFTFPGIPSPSGSPCLFLIGSASGYTYYWPSGIEWGVCDDGENPVMVSAGVFSISGNTVVLSVSATDNSGSVPKYVVNSAEYPVSDGKITITGLAGCTPYTLQVYAKDQSHRVSDNYKEVSFTTGAAGNIALNKPATAGYELNEYHTAAKAVDGNDTGSRWGTQDRPDISYDWIQVDLEQTVYISSVRIKWETARPSQYQILLSKDGTNWFTYRYYSAPEADVYTEYDMHNLAARYVKVVSEINATGYGISIWELEIYSPCKAFVPDDTPPVMVSATEASKTGTSVTLDVSASDNITDPVTTFVIDGIPYTATAGQITIDHLSPCQFNVWDIYALDEGSNLSTNAIHVEVQTGEAAPGTNLAGHKSVYAGFYEGGLVPAHATDEDESTRWGARYRPTAEDDWMVVDLGGVYDVTEIRVAWETGTSINYEFKTALEAEFSVCSKQGVNDDHTLQPAKNCNCIVSGNFATFEHKNEQPWSATQTATNDKDQADKPKAYDIYNYSAEPVLARYIMLKSGLNANYPSSFWEIKVYGSCGDVTHKPVMTWAEPVTVTSTAAEVYVSALDLETPESAMKYIVEVMGGESGYFQLTTSYSFHPSQFEGGKAGHLMIGGLLPEVPYEVRVYAEDEDGNRSENYKSLSFTTSSDASCIFASTEAFNIGETGNHSSRNFQKGYRVTITGDADQFTVVAYTDDDFWELDPPIIQILGNPSEPIISGVTERTMAKVLGVDRTYSYDFSRTGAAAHTISPWSGTVTFFVKYPFRDGGICLTQPIEYDILNGCGQPFIIFHHDDAPTASSETTYAGGLIDQPISYYRHFTAGVWEDITLPFEVEAVRVYDTEDHQYYDLKAQYNDGSVHKGQFLLRKQADNVSGEGFVPGWYDGNTPLPQKNQPYAIRFTSTYYADKYVLFTGAKDQTIASSFTKGTTPTAADQYQVYGNNTMQYQSVGSAYLLPANHGDETYRLTKNSAQVRPFETYVLASEETIALMPVIGRWRGTPAVATSLDEVTDLLAPQDRVEVYSISGIRVMQRVNCSLQEVADECEIRLMAGCYLIRIPGQTIKIIVK